MNSSLSWDDIGFLKKESQGLPLLLKGVLHPKDAELSLDRGIDGIIVSNHGGRRMDGEVAALDVLPGICDVVSGRIPVLLDSGIRSGVDVVKALALGAKAVLVGRLCAYALAVGGEEGVKKALQDLMKEIDSALAICGFESIAQIDRSILMRA
jgi:lactate 2-monooxygenase